MITTYWVGHCYVWMISTAPEEISNVTIIFIWFPLPQGHALEINTCAQFTIGIIYEIIELLAFYNFFHGLLWFMFRPIVCTYPMVMHCMEPRSELHCVCYSSGKHHLCFMGEFSVKSWLIPINDIYISRQSITLQYLTELSL